MKKLEKELFCTCGLSSKDPYCETSHEVTGFSTEIVILDEDKKVAWCGCRNASKVTFCDGSKKRL